MFLCLESKFSYVLKRCGFEVLFSHFEDFGLLFCVSLFFLTPQNHSSSISAVYIFTVFTMLHIQ